MRKSKIVNKSPLIDKHLGIRKFLIKFGYVQVLTIQEDYLRLTIITFYRLLLDRTLDEIYYNWIGEVGMSRTNG